MSAATDGEGYRLWTDGDATYPPDDERETPDAYAADGIWLVLVDWCPPVLPDRKPAQHVIGLLPKPDGCGTGLLG